VRWKRPQGLARRIPTASVPARGDLLAIQRTHRLLQLCPWMVRPPRFGRGNLSRSDTGANMVNLSRASECDNGSGWSYRWNLTTGGTIPAFSSQSGFLMMKQDSLTSKGTLPLIDAYYWFDYPLNLTGNDFL